MGVTSSINYTTVGSKKNKPCKIQQYNYFSYDINDNKYKQSDEWYFVRKFNTDQLHNINDKPALIHYYPNGIIKESLYYKYGKIHRYDGPAKLMYSKTGIIQTEEWYNNGVLQCDNGPANKQYTANGRLLYEQWYDNGLLIRQKNYHKDIMISDEIYRNGKMISKKKYHILSGELIYEKTYINEIL